MSSLLKRGLIFCTFFVACAAAALLLAGLGTKYWIQASAKRIKNPLESDGKIHFGLFEGRKELNVAYGWRTYDIDVIATMKYEPEFLNYWFWIGTIGALCLGLLFSLLSAVFAVINTATTTHRYLAGLSGLILWNFLTFFTSLCGIGLWIAQYYTTIQYNVLTREDRNNEWTSEGMAELSFSFWFVVGAACAAFVNIIIIVISTSEKETETIIPVLEEKTNGAIMLY
ncbi:clarin-2 [Sitophilus oryzae]|uniref:Clarin-2 n=1 Tax=Sitophilus oryzae TaxID=7048 RepID=A0A6J2XUY2_SITOR|nr:clarin-2 [Sitophilus oryzae]